MNMLSAWAADAVFNAIATRHSVRGYLNRLVPQGAFAHYHAVIRKELHLAPEDMVVCGMSLGFADENATANRLRAEREPVAGFATFHLGAQPADNDGAAPHG